MIYKKIKKTLSDIKKLLCKKQKNKIINEKYAKQYLDNQKKHEKNYQSKKKLIFYSYLIYSSNILTNFVLILEKKENFLKANLPNLIYPFLVLLLTIVFQFKLKKGLQLNKGDLKKILFFLIFCETIFFTQTKIFIDLTQKVERIYFKTLLFFFSITILTSFLRSLTRIYTIILITGYILLNIWIYEKYDIFTVTYDLIAYFSIIFMCLLLMIDVNNKVLVRKKQEKKLLKSNLNKKKIMNCNISTTLKKSLDKNENKSNISIEILNKFSQGIVILSPKREIKFMNKKTHIFINDTCQNKFLQESKENKFLKIFSETKYNLKNSKLSEIFKHNHLPNQSNFDEILIHFFVSNDKKVFHCTFNENLTFLLKIIPLQYNNENCAMMIIDLKKFPPNKIQLEIVSDLEGLQAKEMKSQIENLQENLDFFRYFIPKTLNENLNSLQNFCFPLFEYCFSNEKKEIPKNVIEFLFFQMKFLESQIHNCLDISSFKTIGFSLNFQSLNLRTFISEISQIFSPITREKKIELQVLIDDLTPEFIMTDFFLLKKIIFNLLSLSLRLTSSGFIKIAIDPYQIQGNIIIHFRIQDSGKGLNADDLNNLKFCFENYDHNNFLEYELFDKYFNMILPHIFAVELGIEPNSKESGLKIESKENIGSIFSFYILDKSQLLNINLPLLKEKNIMTIKSNVKNYKGFISDNQRAIEKKSSLSCLEYDNSIKNPSGIMISENKYKFLEKLDEKNLDSFILMKTCNCYDVLIIDDDIFNSFAIELFLLDRNIKCVRRRSEAEVFFLIQETVKNKCGFCEGFKLIIINCEILEGNSHSITKELKSKMKNRIIPEINIVGVLEKTRNFEKNLCFEAGMRDILFKPISKEGLNRIIKDWFA